MSKIVREILCIGSRPHSWPGEIKSFEYGPRLMSPLSYMIKTLRPTLGAQKPRCTPHLSD